VSSPAKPARVVCVPGSRIRALISSVRAEGLELVGEELWGEMRSGRRKQDGSVGVREGYLRRILRLLVLGLEGGSKPFSRVERRCALGEVLLGH